MVGEVIWRLYSLTKTRAWKQSNSGSEARYTHKHKHVSLLANKLYLKVKLS